MTNNTFKSLKEIMQDMVREGKLMAGRLELVRKSPYTPSYAELAQDHVDGEIAEEQLRDAFYIDKFESEGK